MRKFTYLLLFLFASNISFAQTDKDVNPPAVFRFVEQMPEPGYDVLAYLNKHVKYPLEARQKGIEGKVNVRFIVDEKGNIDSVHTTGIPLGGGCDEEAVRIVKTFPPWKPGRQNGKAVKVYWIQPILFRFDNR